MTTITSSIQELDFFRLLIANVPVGIQINQLIYNEYGEPVDFQILDLNLAAEKHIGLKREDVIGRRIKEFFPKAEKEWFIKYGEVVKKEKSTHFQMYGRSLGLWLDVQVIPLGSNNKFGILFQDITELKSKEAAEKKALEALAESEKRYRAIVENAGEGIIITKTNGIITFVNQRLANMLGYDVDEMLGRPDADFTFPDWVNNFHKATMEVRENDVLKGEYKLRRKDGSHIWTHYTGVCMFNDQGEHIANLALHTDITDLKEIEIEKEHYMKVAQEKAAWLQAIMDLIPAGVWISDQTGKIIKINREGLNMYRGPSPLSGRDEEYTSYRLFLPGTDQEVSFEPYPPKEALDGVILDYERFDGTRGTLIASTDALRDKDENIINYLAVAMDITPLTQAQRALQESEKNALDLVMKLNIADQNKNEFINMLSHELRNPLASIMMSLELLERVVIGGEQAYIALDIAKRQGKQLSNLVDGLLDVTRITQNKIVLKKETLEINNLIYNAVKDYESLFIDKDVKLEVKLTSPLYIEADYSHLTQVIGNLLHNAAKFTDTGDVVLVSVDQDVNANEVLISVQDTGRGIDPRDQQNLFEPFMQVDKSLDRGLGGLGLGLSIVKGIVALHGGRVEVFSEGIGKGTNFTIRLPL